MTRESEFEFNKEFTMIYGKGSMEGIMYNLCTRKQHNLIHCRYIVHYTVQNVVYSTHVQGESKKSVIYGAWHKSVPFSVQLFCMVFSIFFSVLFFFSQKLKFRKAKMCILTISIEI